MYICMYIHIYVDLYQKRCLYLHQLAFGKRPTDTAAYTDLRINMQIHKFRTVIARMRVHSQTRSVLSAFFRFPFAPFRKNAPRGNRTPAKRPA